MEADIQARYHVDYRSLPLDRLAVYVRHLPDDAAVWAIDRDGPLWTLTDHLLDDVRQWLMIVAGAKSKEIKPHPQRPKPLAKTVDPARMKKIIDARKRLHERQRAIAAGEIT